jgi:hypothetical protein
VLFDFQWISRTSAGSPYHSKLTLVACRDGEDKGPEQLGADCKVVTVAKVALQGYNTAVPLHWLVTTVAKLG